MSISDNNFGLPEVPTPEEPSETSQTTETGSLGDHEVSTVGEENPQVSGQGDETIQNIGKESMASQTLPPRVSITTSGGESASRLAEDIHFSVTSEGIPSVSRSSSFSSLSSLGESVNLDTTRSSSPTPSSSSVGSTSSSSKLEENLSPLPKYDPADKSSIQTFLKDPRVLANMKEKGGHYIYPDEGRSSFIFIPNGDFSQAKSIKVTNGKSKDLIQNPKDLEMCISKFATAFNQVENNWENQGALQIRQELGLSEGTPVKFTHFTLNLKYKQAVAYGTFNEKEASSGFTPSAWRRGNKIKINKDIWEDTGGLNSVDLSKHASSNPGDENIHYSTETPTHIHTGTSRSPGISPQPQQAPVVVNINVAGGQGGQGGSSTSTSQPSQEKSSSSSKQPQKGSSSSITEDKTNIHTEDRDTGSDAGNSSSDVTTSTGLENLSPNIITETNPIDTPTESIVQRSRIPSLAFPEDSTESFLGKPLLDAARKTSETLQNLLSTVINAPTNPINPSSTPALTEMEKPNQLETILKAVRAHIVSAYAPEGRLQAGGIAQVIKEAENNIEDGSGTVSSPTNMMPRVPSLNLPEEQPGEDLINAARNTSTALQNLLTTVIQTPSGPPPSPPAETNQLEIILKAVRTHVENAYGPQGRLQAGGISQVIKEAENQ